ncbi:MAG: hypothetical protein ACK4UO_04220 [Pseudolabrys sp.]
MSTALALNFRLGRTALLRWLTAGTAWGLALAAGFYGMALWQCGLPCPDEAAFMALTCVGTGLLTLGPLAAFTTPR